MDVAQGNLDWKHAAVQMGVSFASSYVGGMGSQVINMGASGIEYKDGGGIGWSNDQLQEGIKGGVVNMAMNYTLNSTIGQGAWSSGISSGLMSGLETDGKWYEFGFDTDNMAEHITTGIASGATAAIMKAMKMSNDAQGNTIDGDEDKMFPNVYNNGYTQKAISGFINSSIMTLGYNLMDGEGFENNYSQINWMSMAYSHTDLAGDLGSKFQTYLKEKYGDKDKAENQKRKGDSVPEDPISNEAEDWLSGAYLTLKGVLGSMGSQIIEDVKESWDNLVNLGRGASDLYESAGNLFAHGEFMNDDTYNALYGSDVNALYDSELGKEMLANGELRGPVTDEELLVTGLDAAFKQSQPKYVMMDTGWARQNPDGTIDYDIQQPTQADLYAYNYGGKAQDVLFGCQDEASGSYKMTTGGDNLTEVFGDQFSSLTENEKLAATKYYMEMMSDGIYDNFIEQGYSAEDARNMTVLKLANTLADNVEIGYIFGSKLNKDGTGTGLWTGSNLDTWEDNTSPNLDCSGFVSMVLETMGYNVPDGVKSMVSNNSLFDNVNDGDVKVGDFASTADNKHILIVSEVKNGNASQFIHSSSWDYNQNPMQKNYPGVYRSSYRPYDFLRFKRLRGK